MRITGRGADRREVTMREEIRGKGYTGDVSREEVMRKGYTLRTRKRGRNGKREGQKGEENEVIREIRRKEMKVRR